MLAALVATAAAAAEPGPLLPYEVEGDGIAASLTGRPGDPVRGRQIVTSRQVGTCLLCHPGPFPEERVQGTIGPDLAGVGSRLSAAEIRLRLVDAARVVPNSLMPSYYVVDGLTRVGKPWQGRPVLSAEEIEDAVAFLLTLREK